MNERKSSDAWEIGRKCEALVSVAKVCCRDIVGERRKATIIENLLAAWWLTAGMGEFRWCQPVSTLRESLAELPSTHFSFLMQCFTSTH